MNAEITPRKSPIPVYYQIVQELRSRMTLRQALAILANEGLLNGWSGNLRQTPALA
jgi:DNA-binding GntR family transcriptional regulator